jgi:hypothetical protein
MNPSKGTNNQTKGTNKNSLLGLRLRTLSRLDEKRNPADWVGYSVIAARFKDNTFWSRAWLDTARTLVNFGRIYPGRNFGVTYSAFKRECSKQFQLVTSEKLNTFRNLS